MKKIFLFGVLLLSVGVCANNDIPKWEDSKPIEVLPQTEYDIFNLRWGMKKDECYRICDWGGKFERKVEHPAGFRLLRFSFCKEYPVSCQGNLFFLFTEWHFSYIIS